MSGSGLVALPDVWEWSRGPAKCPGVVGKPSWMSGRPSLMSKVGSPSRMSESGREAHQKSGNGWEAVPEVREGSGDSPRSL